MAGEALDLVFHGAQLVEDREALLEDGAAAERRPSCGR
jgi:hypothetical protein